MADYDLYMNAFLNVTCLPEILFRTKLGGLTVNQLFAWHSFLQHPKHKLVGNPNEEVLEQTIIGKQREMHDK